MFVTALHVATEELPFRKFPGLIKLQKQNGVKFVRGKANQKTCAAMIDIMAEVLEGLIQDYIKESPFFTIEFDGSCALKTGSDKELVYIKIMVS